MSSSTPPATRKMSKNMKTDTPPPALTLQDFKKLTAEMEARIVSKFSEKIDALMKKVSDIESSITEIKAVQAQQETDIDIIKDIIASQQRQIESFEIRERRCNLIVSNVPETSVTFDREKLEDDTEKFLVLANEMLVGCKSTVGPDNISEIVRLGRPGVTPRIMKVKLHDESLCNSILRSGKFLRSDRIRTTFGTIYVNKDVSYLRRKEERRLRLKRKELKDNFPDADVRIKNGKLYLGPAIRDQVDVANQLF